MASFDNYFYSLLKKTEGGYTENVEQPTNMGVTLKTWLNFGYDNDRDGDIDTNDLKLMTDSQAYNIYKNKYWNRINGDKIKNQDIANIVFDHFINSDTVAVKMLQRILNYKYNSGLAVDGELGEKTILALNNSNTDDVYNEYREARKAFYTGLVNNNPDKYSKYLKGWLNRVREYFPEIVKKKAV